MAGTIKQRQILVIDEDEMLGNSIAKAAGKKDYEVINSENIDELFQVNNSGIMCSVVMELKEPVKKYLTLIDLYKKHDCQPVIFIQSDITNPEVIIDAMRAGADNYYIKPVDYSQMFNSLEDKISECDMKKAIEIANREKINNLQSQLQWYKWEERTINRDKSSMTESLFHSLQISFNRAAGIGALVTLMELIADMADEKEDGYLVEKDIFKAAIENAKMSKKTIDVFSEIDRLIDNELDLNPLSLKEVHDILGAIAADMGAYAGYKRQSLILNKAVEDFSKVSVMINKNRFRDAIVEVLINAFKFSLPDTKIMIILYKKDSLINLSIISEPEVEENGMKGIPVEYQNLVFEPFFRISKKVQHEYKTLEIGLGLSLVEKIVIKHRGSITLSNIIDYSDISREPVPKVHVEITLPLVENPLKNVVF